MKDLFYGRESRLMIKNGMKEVLQVIKPALGPRGRNIMIDKGGRAPLITNRGTDIISDIQLEEETRNIGAQILRDVAAKTAEQVGDGSLISAVLAQAIIEKSIKNIEAGGNPILLKKGIASAVDMTVSLLNEMAIMPMESEQIDKIVHIAIKDRKVAEDVSDIISKLGKDAVITVEESKSLVSTVEIVRGIKFDMGYISPYLLTKNEEMSEVLEKPYILFTDNKISDMKDIIPIMDSVARSKGSLLIIADNVEGEALKSLIINKAHGAINVIAVRAPGFGERKKALLEDMALMTGGEVISADKGMELSSAQIQLLGRAESVTVSRKNTLIVGGAGDDEEIKRRIETSKKRLSEAQRQCDEFAVDRAKERLAKLVGAIGVIKVGGMTEAEQRANRVSMENSVKTVLACMDEGVVPGGGIAYCNVADAMENEVSRLPYDERVGADIVREALKVPARLIIENAGLNGEFALEECRKIGEGTGMDVVREKYVNMYDAGILDSVKVLRTALVNAASMAGTCITAEVNIVE